MPHTSILIPAHNEAAYLGDCLTALLRSDPISASVDQTLEQAALANDVPIEEVELIVIPNACTDSTSDIAQSFAADFQARGWGFTVLATDQPGKLNALNLGEAKARGAIRIYLDADVTVDPALVPALIASLDVDQAAYASGTPQVWTNGNWAIRTYARFWQSLPFLSTDVPGFGIFAVNAAGRARWGTFPDIISDDTFVRLHFAPSERIRLAAPYRWPMVDTLTKLIRVRRRQDIGVAEVNALFPALSANEPGTHPDLKTTLTRMLHDPIGFAIYAAISLAVKLPILRSETRWVRGR